MSLTREFIAESSSILPAYSPIFPPRPPLHRCDLVLLFFVVNFSLYWGRLGGRRAARSGWRPHAHRVPTFLTLCSAYPSSAHLIHLALFEFAS